MLDKTELSLLLHENRPVQVGPCRVCGADLQVAAMEAGKADYVCSSPEADTLAAGARDQEKGLSSWNGPESTKARDHYDRSRKTITFRGDSRIVMALTELRDLRGAQGEDMEVPVGAEHYPYGHGRGLCWRRMVHRGQNHWVDENDHDYLHAPDHKTSNVE